MILIRGNNGKKAQNWIPPTLSPCLSNFIHNKNRPTDRKLVRERERCSENEKEVQKSTQLQLHRERGQLQNKSFDSKHE